ncbi:MAG TPA: cytochrome c oxidase subunit 4 [Acidimicrobiales bacterium]|nr:cytochrome c oxidase subunit 4 [Acidimicrobiales bacterium]
MKVEWRTILGASVFLGGTGAVYWAFKNNPTESSGVAMLIFGFCAYGMLFGFLLLQYIRRHRIPRPEDRFDANYSDPDAEGEISYFPSASIWPAGMGLGAVIGAVALVWGLWYLFAGAVIFLGAVIGYVVESDREADAVERAEERVRQAAGQQPATHAE